MAVVPRHWEYDEVFDSLDRGCGDFIIEVHDVIRELPTGGQLMIASRDAGAPIEIPAWCRITGHVLVDQAPPYFLVRKRQT